MESNLLRKAREYEALHRPALREQLPVFHVTGGVGWINDPNGFGSYRDEYHLFFQYYPYDTQWGPMHWGHVKTRDFIRWEFLPAALAPDQEYDRDGCFSGGALELPDGRHLLMYTGVSKQLQSDGTVKDVQSQCLALGDGINYRKYPLNPVLSAGDLPMGGSPFDFRDPKIWEENGRFYAVIVNRGSDGSGDVLLYESEDGFSWRFKSTLSQCSHRYGNMWECPDFFHLDGKAVLIHSVMEMEAQGLEYHCGNAKICHIGQLENGRMTDEAVHAMEYGLDFYAPQTLETKDGRRILIGWMQGWESSNRRPKGLGFLGQMTIPRELTLRGGRLCQLPVRELERYRSNPVSCENIRIWEMCSLPGIQGRVLELLLEIQPEKTGYTRFDLEIAKDERYKTTITLLPEEGIIRMDRTYSGFPHDVVHVRQFPADFREGSIRLRLILDRYSAELFVNEGQQAASMVLYTRQSAREITFRSDRPVRLNLQKYDISLSEFQEFDPKQTLEGGHRSW